MPTNVPVYDFPMGHLNTKTAAQIAADTPDRIGQFVHETDNDIIYYAVGTTGPSDWVRVDEAFIKLVGALTASKLTVSDSASQPPLNLTERSSAPSSPSAGDIYLDDGTNTASTNPGFRRYTGSVWEDVSSGGGGGGGENNYLVMKLLSAFVGAGIFQWQNNVINDSNYWGSGDAEKLLLANATGNDYVLDVYGSAVNNSGSADEVFNLIISRYNSSDVKQAEYFNEEFFVPQGATTPNPVAWKAWARVQQNDITAGDYLVVEVGGAASFYNVACELYEFTTLQE